MIWVAIAALIWPAFCLIVSRGHWSGWRYYFPSLAFALLLGWLWGALRG